jgi:hypothetical protein
MTINDRLTTLHEYFDGCFNQNIEPNSIAYWKGLPVIHDKIAKRYLIIMSEGQFESLIKAQEEK